MQGLIVLLMFVGIIVCWPLAVIWALNELFALGIDYTFWNWLATFVLGAAARGNVSFNRNED